MKDKILNTNRDVVNGANKSKENCNLISDGHEKSISVPDQSYTQIVDRHEVIYLSKKYNFEKCLLPVKSGINIDFFKFMLTDYEDKEICRFLEYGFPLGIDYANPDLDLILKVRVITKLPNSEQSYKGKVKTHTYINRQNQSTTGKL